MMGGGSSEQAAPQHSQAEQLHQRFERIWGTRPGLGQLSVVNHSNVSRRFIITGFVFFLLGGLQAMLLRTQLAMPDNDFLDHEVYNQLFTMHGTTMMFLFAVPVLEGIAFYLLPKMIGSRDMLYPRLSAYGYWCYLFGGILLYSSFLEGSVPDAGWFMYVPLASSEYTPGLNSDFWLLGITFVEISAVSAGIELVATILKARAPGMGVNRMPLFAWYMLVTGFMIILGFPPLILGSILLELERAFGWPFFMVGQGGDPLLWQHLFWLFGHPEVYIIFLPAAGIVTMAVATFARHPVVGYSWVVLAVVATGFISFMIWVHHMYTVGLPQVAQGFFSAASMGVAIPSGIQVFVWIATLWLGRAQMRVPMLFLMGFLFIFVLGGLTGVMLALASFDWQVHDTHFVVAHLHYVLIGGMLFPFFAGLYYWLPLMSGREYSELFGRLAFWLLFIGFNITFLPMHLTGMLGMTRRTYTYPEGLGWEIINLISTVGGFLMAAGVAAFIMDLYLHYRFGRRATANSWEAGTLEWSLRHPAPSYNFISLPQIRDRYPLWHNPKLPQELAEGQGYLADPGSGERETMATSMLDAKPEYVVRLPRNTYIPLLLALATALFFIGLLIKQYWLVPIAAVLMVAGVWRWLWDRGIKQAPLVVDAGQGLKLPLQYSHPRGPGWWAMGLSILADLSLYGSLLFGYLFLWTVAPAWPPPDFGALPWLVPSLGLGGLILSSVAMGWAGRQLRVGSLPRLRLGYGLAILLALAYGVSQVLLLRDAPYGPQQHAYGAILHALAGCHLLHVGLVVLMACFILARSAYGYVVSDKPMEVTNVSLFWHYVVLQCLVGYVALHMLPLLM